MLVLAGLWKLYTRKTSGALKKNPSERGNSMVWPTHEVHFRTAFHPPPMSNVASDSTKKTIRYDNAGFGRLVEVVDMEDLWDLEKKPFKTGKLHGLADSRGRFSVHMSSSASVKRCV